MRTGESLNGSGQDECDSEKACRLSDHPPTCFFPNQRVSEDIVERTDSYRNTGRTGPAEVYVMPSDSPREAKWEMVAELDCRIEFSVPRRESTGQELWRPVAAGRGFASRRTAKRPSSERQETTTVSSGSSFPDSKKRLN